VNAAPGAAGVLEHVRDVVAIHSAKGGVGKSTVAANLAVALARLGLRVGLLDADVHGPSIAHMFGSDARPEAAGDGARVLPIERYGVRFLSLANVVTPDAPVIWRGPMVVSALQQLVTMVDWGDLDVLLLDLPPGTGDAVLSLAQMIALSGVVVVTTPQEMSLSDTRRGIQAFAKLDVPILGLIENMSMFVCDVCGTQAALFGEGGGRVTAERMGLPFLGRVPIVPAIREAGDAGEPLAHREPESATARAFDAIARPVIAALAHDERVDADALTVTWRRMKPGDVREAPPGAKLPAPAPGPPRALRLWQAADDRLSIAWSDGARTFHGAYDLRTSCPCAMCVEEWTGRRMPSLDAVPRDVRPIVIRPVGRYAIQPEWSDGHKTGIYSFADLRRAGR
jgi:ATP-binding protein involved in chromosome partitioning